MLTVKCRMFLQLFQSFQHYPGIATRGEKKASSCFCCVMADVLPLSRNLIVILQNQFSLLGRPKSIVKTMFIVAKYICRCSQSLWS